jgi:citrate lyase subunit beta/citryl-CoA lyase
MTGALPRSYLYVPGDQPDRLAKAPARGADALIADLEDAVAPAGKAVARAGVRRWLSAGFRGEVWLRINVGQAGQDIAEVVSGELTGVVVPKAEPGLLAEVNDLLAARERALSLPPGAIGVLPLIETAAGLLAAAALATAPRVVRLGIGEADLAAELGLAPDPDSDELTWLRLQVVVASAAGRIAGPVAPMSADFRELAALRASTLALRRLGFRARTAIHPAQVAVINEVFTPSTEEVARALKLIAAFEEAEQTGAGVITDDTGRMVDVAIVRSARDIVARDAAAREKRGHGRHTPLGGLCGMVFAGRTGSRPRIPAAQQPSAAGPVPPVIPSAPDGLTHHTGTSHPASTTACSHQCGGLPLCGDFPYVHDARTSAKRKYSALSASPGIPAAGPVPAITPYARTADPHHHRKILHSRWGDVPRRPQPRLASSRNEST